MTFSGLSARDALTLFFRHIGCSLVGHSWVEQGADLPIFDLPFYVCRRCGNWRRRIYR